MKCPKTESDCKYGLRELDPELCVWCSNLDEIRLNKKEKSRRGHKKDPDEEPVRDEDLTIEAEEEDAP